MPQLGQRRPKSTRKVQGGNPSCWCVPKPRPSGSEHRRDAQRGQQPQRQQQHSQPFTAGKDEPLGLTRFRRVHRWNSWKMTRQNSHKPDWPQEEKPQGRALDPGAAGYSKRNDRRASALAVDSLGVVICSIIQRLTSSSICGASSWPQGYCRSVTEIPAECNSRRSSQTWFCGYSGLSRPTARNTGKRRIAARLASKCAAHRQRAAQRQHAGKAIGMAHRQPQGHGAAAIEPGQEYALRADVQLSAGDFDAVEDSLLRLLDVIVGLLPAKAAASLLGRGDFQAPRGHCHVVLHAHQGHDPQDVPFVAVQSVQPDQQRIRIAGLVVQRSEQAMDRIAGGRFHSACFNLELGRNWHRRGQLLGSTRAVHTQSVDEGRGRRRRTRKDRASILDSTPSAVGLSIAASVGLRETRGFKWPARAGPSWQPIPSPTRRSCRSAAWSSAVSWSWMIFSTPPAPRITGTPT